MKHVDGIGSTMLGPPTPDAGSQHDYPNHQEEHKYQDGHDPLDLPSVVYDPTKRPVANGGWSGTVRAPVIS